MRANSGFKEYTSSSKPSDPGYYPVGYSVPVDNNSNLIRVRQTIGYWTGSEWIGVNGKVETYYVDDTLRTLWFNAWHDEYSQRVKEE